MEFQLYSLFVSTVDANEWSALCHGRFTQVINHLSRLLARGCFITTFFVEAGIRILDRLVPKLGTVPTKKKYQLLSCIPFCSTLFLFSSDIFSDQISG
jgi:hypothetical protein